MTDALFFRRTRTCLSATCLSLCFSAMTAAQMPSMPTLQNAWASPSLVGAIDIGGGADGTVYAGAVSLAPASRIQVSGGLGAVSRANGRGTKGVYGARVAFPFGGAASTFGFAGFVGVGGILGTSAKATTATDSVASTTQVPIGAALGWRHTIGGSHGVSAYASPSYVLYSGGTKSGGLVRVGIGADFGISSALGVTLGGELGQSRAKGLGGPSGALYGIGLSYAFRHK